jgi:hypothetical protein
MIVGYTQEESTIREFWKIILNANETIRNENNLEEIETIIKLNVEKEKYQKNLKIIGCLILF